MSLTRPVQRALESFTARKPHYIRKRLYAEEFANQQYPDVAQQLRNCHETEVLACCGHCGKSWYILNRCRLRVCPLCSYEVSKRRGHYLLALTNMMQYPKLLTLTMDRWQGNPHNGIKYLRDKWNLLRKHPLFKTVLGGAYQIEVLPHPEGYHIHMHVLIDAPYIPYQKLFTLWGSLIDQDAPQIDIRAAKTKPQRIYAAKHAAKSADFYADPTTVVEWYEATKGQRLFATFGKWFNAKLEELPGASLLEPQVPTCPFCAAERTTFLARDGPWIIGHQDWITAHKHFTGGDEDPRVLQELRKRLDNLLAQEKTQLPLTGLR